LRRKPRGALAPRWVDELRECSNEVQPATKAHKLATLFFDLAAKRIAAIDQDADSHAVIVARGRVEDIREFTDVLRASRPDNRCANDS
jgi:hypothetical protein